MPKYADEHTYHIYNRGAHRSAIFRKSTHYLRCIELIRKYSARYHVTVIAYCLMPNHYHMLVRQDLTGSISRFLQTTFNAYVQYFNILERHSGTLFQGPAKSRLIESDAQLMRCLAYVHTNPVRASLVRNAMEWEYTDYATWAGNSGVNLASRQLRNCLIESGKAYQEFVKAYLLKGDSEDDMEP
ncbi:MAG: transposase [Ignavibacteriales bacterium]|nr:transposase [Ignavibacteriales bacterium]